MPSYYWIKLYHEILDDYKMASLSDRLFRRTIQLFLLAGEYGHDGQLPTLDQMAWRLRTGDPPEILEAELVELSRLGIIGQSNGEWVVAHFKERQAKVSDAERQRRYRERQSNAPITTQSRTSHEPVTNRDNPNLEADKDSYIENVTIRNTDIDIDKDIDKKREDIYAEIRQEWAIIFPSKPQPRATNKTLRGKTQTRIKDPYFKENWKAALSRAGSSSFLRREPWFDLGWFLANDINYEKCLQGNYDDRHNGRGPGDQNPARRIDRIKKIAGDAHDR